MDKHAPPGWFRSIDLDLLNVADGTRCVLGQTWRNYGWACRWFELNGTRCTQLGFLGIDLKRPCPNECCPKGERVSSNAELNIAWRAEINRRRLTPA